jgi:hypothetical protein
MSAQVGDTLSLRARTEFESGQHELARRYANEAQGYLFDRSSKAYLDLLILQAEISYTLNGAVDALTALEPILSADVDGSNFETSEIYARALALAARLRRASGLEWSDRFDQAIEILGSADATFAVAELRWWDYVESGLVPAPVQALLAAEPPPVRVVAWELNPVSSSDQAASVVMNKELDGRPLLEAWTPILEEARQRVVVSETGAW